MARTELPEEILEPTPEEIIEQEPDANENAVEMLFQQAASENDWKYRVLRKTGETSRDLEFVMEAMPSDFPSQSSLELYLTQNYGGGKYRVLVYFRGKLKKNIELRIAESKLVHPMQSGGFDQAGVKITQVLERMIATSSEQHRSEMQALREELKTLRQAPAPDPLVQMAKLAELMRTLIPPVAAPVTSHDGFSDMMRFMELQERLEERFRERNRDPDAPTSFADILQSAPKIIEAIRGMRNPEPNALPAPVPGASVDKPTPVLDASTAPAITFPPRSNGDAVSDDLSKLIPLFQVLNGQAMAGNDPATYAALIEDNADSVAGPGTLDRLLALPDLQARIESVYPQAKAHADWWAELIELLREEPKPDAGDSSSAAGEHSAN